VSVLAKTRRSAHGLDDHGEPWQTRAACRSQSPDMFLRPFGGGTAALAQARRGLNVCAHCPVDKACGQWADSLQPAQRQDLILAGEVYSSAGERLRRCVVCDRPTLTDARATYCEMHDWNAAQRETEYSERNRRIKAAAAAGKTLREIAQAEQISFQRVSEIARATTTKERSDHRGQ
jgi:hypothetical protein